MGKFNKGVFLGGLLGAAIMWFNVTPKGKEMRAKLLQHADALFEQIKDSLKQLEGPTKEMYDALVERAVAEYADKKEIAIEMKNRLIKDLKKKWSALEADTKKK